MKNVIYSSCRFAAVFHRHSSNRPEGEIALSPYFGYPSALFRRRDCRAKYDVALRRWGEYVYANVGRNVTYFLDALLYAKRNGLLLLHTGDLIDFYSPANLEAAERLLGAGRSGLFPVCGESRIHQLFRPASGEPGGAGGSPGGKSRKFLPTDSILLPRIIGGVNFIAIDNSSGFFPEESFDFFNAEAARGCR